MSHPTPIGHICLSVALAESRYRRSLLLTIALFFAELHELNMAIIEVLFLLLLLHPHSSCFMCALSFSLSGLRV